MSTTDRWEPIEYPDIRKGDILLILTTASHDSPTREQLEALGSDWKAYLKVGATDPDTRLLRLAPDDDGGAA